MERTTFPKNCTAFLLRGLHPEHVISNVPVKQDVKLKIDNDYRRVDSQLALSVFRLAFLLSDRKCKKSFLHFLQAKRLQDFL